MFKRTVLTSLLVVILVLPSTLVPDSLAQDTWTCDGGPNEVWNVALVAFNQGDLTMGLTLAATANRGCGPSHSSWAGPGWIVGAQSQAVLPTVTPAQASADQQQMLTLYQHGQTAFNAGQLEQALSLYKQALAIARQIGDRTSEGRTLYNIGEVYWAMGQYTQALDILSQALAVTQEVGDRVGEDRTLNIFGVVYKDQGQYAKALDYYAQALAIAREMGDQSEVGSTLNNVGAVYDEQGRYTQALDYYTQALAVVRGVGNQVAEATTFNNIGLVYNEQGQYAKALEYEIQALAMAHGAGDRWLEGITLTGIGGIYDDQGQYTRALDYFTQALTIARDMGDPVSEATRLNNIGKVYHEQGQYAKALDDYTQALAIVRAVGDRRGEGRTLSNISGVYKHQGQYPQALDYAMQALAIQHTLGDREGQGRTLSNIGLVYVAQGQYAKALDAFAQALAIAREVGDQVGETSTLNSRGSLYEQLGQRDQALVDYRSAVESIEGVLNAASLDSAVASLAAKIDNRYPYQRLAVLLAQEGKLAEALNYVERGRAILIRSQLSGKPIDFRANADQVDLQREADLLTALNSAQKVLDSLHKDTSASAAAIQQAQTVLDKARSDYQQQLEAMQLHGGFLTRQIARVVAPLDKIQAALPADTTLVVYAVGDPDSVVFLVTSKTLDAVSLKVTARQIGEPVSAFASDRRANADALDTLYNLVIAPIASKLTTKHLIFATDGDLNYVPFAALQAPDAHYLIDQYSVSLIASGTTLVLLKEAQGQRSGQPRLPDLVLAQPAAPGLLRLAHARAEASAIAHSLGVDPILDASGADLRGKSSGAQVITISAHAELDSYAPLFSAIYLKADDQSDGRFEVRQIYELDLSRGTDLVVLSGCNTASGGDGEDFGVLTRAFFGAGTPRVVASLWSVDDESTAFLMSAFFGQHATTSGEADALRAALLATRSKYPEPYFWAGFVLSGLP